MYSSLMHKVFNEILSNNCLEIRFTQFLIIHFTIHTLFRANIQRLNEIRDITESFQSIRPHIIIVIIIFSKTLILYKFNLHA